MRSDVVEEAEVGGEVLGEDGDGGFAGELRPESHPDGDLRVPRRVPQGQHQAEAYRTQTAPVRAVTVNGHFLLRITPEKPKRLRFPPNWPILALAQATGFKFALGETYAIHSIDRLIRPSFVGSSAVAQDEQPNILLRPVEIEVTGLARITAIGKKQG